MTSKEFAQKFNTTIEIAVRIIDKVPCRVFVKSFSVYDEFDSKDTDRIKMEQFLKEHPDYEKIYFHQQGPCSNWGYDIFRLETEREYQSRIKKEIKRLSKFPPKYFKSKSYKISQKILKQLK